MAEDGKVRALFVVRGVARAGWYRCVLPAMYGGYDWIAIGNQPPELQVYGSWVDGQSQTPDFGSYDVVVFQQLRGEKWRAFMKKLQERGVTVLYEIDDYVHGINKALDHDFSAMYREHHLKDMETCMRQANGVIFSTEHLAGKYDRFARRSWVCENGLDMGRYRLTRPERGAVGGRETVTIMWAGATGHQLAVFPWMEAVAKVMRETPHASFVSVGQNFAKLLVDEFPDRVLAVPFTGLECYPAAMMLGDVSVAPAGNSEWYKAKSDLRVMESAALGIPVVADRKYAGAVDQGETGYLVRAGVATMGPNNTAVVPRGASAEIVAPLRRLVQDDELRARMSEAARVKALTEFQMTSRVDQWHRALREAAAANGRI